MCFLFLSFLFFGCLGAAWELPGGLPGELPGKLLGKLPGDNGDITVRIKKLRFVTSAKSCPEPPQSRLRAPSVSEGCLG